MQLSESGLKTLWRVSYPIMLFFFFGNLMMFVDRYYLSRYSLDALKASVSGGMCAWTVICGASALVQISEVFVAQLCGAHRIKLIGPYVWQSIWIALVLGVILLLGSLLAAPILFAKGSYRELELDYFVYISFSGPLFLIFGALTGFFVGRGEGNVVVYSSMLGNIINILLDPLFIFGSEGVITEFSLQWEPLVQCLRSLSIESYGIKGAAVATVIGTFIQLAFFVCMFLKKEYRTTFKTLDWSFNFKMTKEVLALGTPSGLYISLDLLAWTVFYFFMKGISEEHILIAGVCHTVYSMLFFYGLGLEKGASAISGNLVGSKKFDKVLSLASSGSVLILLFILCLSAGYYFFIGDLVDFFILNDWDHSSLSQVMEYATMKSQLESVLFLILIYLGVDSYRLLMYGILGGTGDTFFVMMLGLVRSWFWVLLPTYFIIVLPKLDIQYAFFIWILSSAGAIYSCFLRLKKGAWQEKRISSL